VKAPGWNKWLQSDIKAAETLPIMHGIEDASDMYVVQDSMRCATLGTAKNERNINVKSSKDQW